MVHTFRCADLNLLLDVESGALHALSDAAFAVAKLYGQGLDESEIARRLSHLPEDSVNECVRELSALQRQGLLDSPETATQPMDDGGIVKALCLHVAHDCNMRCGYCFASSGDFTLPRVLMDEKTGMAAMDFLFAHSGQRKYLEVDFFGGEPMLNFPVVQRVVRYARALEEKHGKTVRFTLTSNCYDTPAGAVEFCNREMHNLVLSVDGRQSVHDALRRAAGGGPTHARALRNALAFIRDRKDREYYARGTFTRRNLDFVADAEFLWDAGFDYISIEPVVLPAEHPLCIRERDLPAVFSSYDALLRTILRRRRQGKPHHFYHFMMDLSGGPCLLKRLTGCGAGREYMAVTPEGTLYPCHQFVGRQGFVLGNVFGGALDERVRDAFRQNHVLNKPECRRCFAKYYCSGGCAANAQAYSGRLQTPDPVGCALMRKRTECALALAALENGQNAQAPNA